MHAARFCQSDVLQQPPPDVAPVGDPQRDKFEQVSNDDHQISVTGDIPYLTFPKRSTLPDLSWEGPHHVTYQPSLPMNRQTLVKTLPSFEGICGR